jgi:hypothetical protein
MIEAMLEACPRCRQVDAHPRCSPWKGGGCAFYVPGAGLEMCDCADPVHLRVSEADPAPCGAEEGAFIRDARRVTCPKCRDALGRAFRELRRLRRATGKPSPATALRRAQGELRILRRKVQCALGCRKGPDCAACRTMLEGALPHRYQPRRGT